MKRPSETLSMVIFIVGLLVGAVSALYFVGGLVSQAAGHTTMSALTIELLPISVFCLATAMQVINLDIGIDKRDERIAELEAQITPESAPADLPATPQRPDEIDPQADH